MLRRTRRRRLIHGVPVKRSGCICGIRYPVRLRRRRGESTAPRNASGPSRRHRTDPANARAVSALDRPDRQTGVVRAACKLRGGAVQYPAIDASPSVEPCRSGFARIDTYVEFLSAGQARVEVDTQRTPSAAKECRAAVDTCKLGIQTEPVYRCQRLRCHIRKSARAARQPNRIALNIPPQGRA